MKIFTYEKKTYLLNNNLVSSKVHEKCFLTKASEKQKQENTNILDKKVVSKVSLSLDFLQLNNLSNILDSNPMYFYLITIHD